MKIIIVCVFYPPLKSSAAIQIEALTKELLNQGHFVSVVTPDNSIGKDVLIKSYKNLKIYRFKSGKLTDTSFFKRAINEFSIPFRIIYTILTKSIKLNNHNGIISWSPSIFLSPLILFLKIINSCPSYLILRDLFPRWARDLNLIRNNIFYQIFNFFFLLQFFIADIVGIQSEGNKKFIPKSLFFKKINVKLLKNWYSPNYRNYRTKFDLKKTVLRSKKVFVYAGNIGLAQNIEEIIYLAEKIQYDTDIGFLFIGRGSQYKFLNNIVKKRRISNVLFHKQIPNSQLEELYKKCFGGLVILDKRHKTHNIPGKLISYLHYGLPVFALINKGHDLIKFINENKVGYATDNYDINFLENEIRKFILLIKNDKKIASKCKKVAVKNFNTSTIAKEIIGSLNKFI